MLFVVFLECAIFKKEKRKSKVWLQRLFWHGLYVPVKICVWKFAPTNKQKTRRYLSLHQSEEWKIKTLFFFTQQNHCFWNLPYFILFFKKHKKRAHISRVTTASIRNENQYLLHPYTSFYSSVVNCWTQENLLLLLKLF